jgi:predicted alpha/beta hydrolase family esterase
MRTVFIFHGTGGSPEGNWFPWLKKELEMKGLRVVVPRFPTPEGQSLEAWLTILHQYDEYIDEETIFIGHSLGGMFLLKVLEQLKHPVYAAFFVSASIGVKPIKYYDSDYFFAHFMFDWPAIVMKAKTFTAYHSDNDPYVSLGNGEELAKQLGITLTFIPKAGHINAESGWTKFDKLLQDIERQL